MSALPRTTLLLGGIRSGKSSVACGLAAAAREPVTVLASGVASDLEMAARIAAHRRARPPEWAVVEEAGHPASAIEAIRDGLVLWDSVDSWVGNVMHEAGCFNPDGWMPQSSALGEQLAEEVGVVLQRCEERRLRLIAVSCETGMGPIGATESTRQFVDLLGSVNQLLAARVQAAYLVVAGRVCQLAGGATWNG